MTADNSHIHTKFGSSRFLTTFPALKLHSAVDCRPVGIGGRNGCAAGSRGVPRPRGSAHPRLRSPDLQGPPSLLQAHTNCGEPEHSVLLPCAAASLGPWLSPAMRLAKGQGVSGVQPLAKGGGKPNSGTRPTATLERQGSGEGKKTREKGRGGGTEGRGGVRLERGRSRWGARRKVRRGLEKGAG